MRKPRLSRRVKNEAKDAKRQWLEEQTAHPCFNEMRKKIEATRKRAEHHKSTSKWMREQGLTKKDLK